MKVNDLTITTPAFFDYRTIVQDEWSVSHVYFRKAVYDDNIVSIEIGRGFPDDSICITIGDDEQSLKADFSGGLLTYTNGDVVWVGDREVSSRKHSSKGIMSLQLMDIELIIRYKLYVGEGDLEHLAEVRIIK